MAKDDKKTETKKQPPKASHFTVMNGGPNAKMRTFGGVRLMPGVNKVEAEEAEKIEAHPHFQKLKKAGAMSISPVYPATKDKELEEAKEFVKETHDKELLDEYAADDQRPEVTKAIREKHKELDKEPDAED